MFSHTGSPWLLHCIGSCLCVMLFCFWFCACFGFGAGLVCFCLVLSLFSLFFTYVVGFMWGWVGLVISKWRRGSIPRRSWRSGEPSILGGPIPLGMPESVGRRALHSPQGRPAVHLKHKKTYLTREVLSSRRQSSQGEALSLHLDRVDPCDYPKCR